MHIKMNAGDLQEIIKSVGATEQDEGLIMLKDDKWLMKAVDGSTVLMFATLVPEDAMINYKPGDTEEVGIWLSNIKEMIDSKPDPISLTLENDKLIVEHGGYEASLPTIDPTAVEGVARTTPSIEHCTEFEMDYGNFSNFLSKADSVVGAGHYFMSAREDGLYLYSEKDNKEISKRHTWSSMEESDVSFEDGASPPEGGNDPERDSATDTILSLDYTKRINEMADNAQFHVDNHQPVKIVFEMDSGIKGSYILSPRIPGEGGMATLPDRLVMQETGIADQ